MGRGVFAGRRFRQGEIIEICPVIPLKPSEANACSETILDDYFFTWGAQGKEYALCLGYGELYNHSPHPNATYANRTRELQIVFRATRDIAIGEQILIDYGWANDVKMPKSRV
jgi:SET domain-containing protein